MESEERPAKMRKLEHSEGTDEVEADGTPLNGGVEPQNVTIATEQLSAVTEPGEENIANPVQGNSEGTPKLSKNALKKQRKLEQWEAGREDRKVKRKEQVKAKKERRRQEYAEKIASGEEIIRNHRPARHSEGSGTLIPITVIFDCDFDDMMFENELKSLGLQLTRCYSDNRKAPFRFHVGISSFGGKLKERFDGILAKQYTSWKGVHFCDEDFVEVSEKARGWMKGENGGSVAGALQENDAAVVKDGAGEAEEEGEIIYLSAESDVTLERLKPNSTYIIGGLVDKNRHKGICYKRATERGIKTAKLPIGEFLQMKSRQVLTTNHVMEIMLRWVEYDDWGKAFMTVLPKRKGGMLKSEAGQEDDVEGGVALEDADESQGLEEQD
ncbi:tRNA m(1)G methyltransferase domain-containing protein [Byssothecium circinans]|uniref:tRNA (guanine(9)-N1)-methyltransferase n=1 Tax=Byssothecium circinans TaxID=147558 RepID=A0A6A5TDJ6_9PLEO|nr:tRNA m(1)G methyltransferase domain-containing protein [Byssothecium circinans]